MHDFILSAVEREADGGDYEPISRPVSVSFSTEQSTAFCRSCRDLVEIATAIEAATIFKTDLQDIRFLLDSGDIHLAQPRRPILAICKRSLEHCFETRKTRLLDSHFELKMHGAIRGKDE